MTSFELIYDGQDDVLEITFETFDDHFARTVQLNDAVLLFTNGALDTAWGLTFYNFTTLLQISETHLDGLRAVPEADARRVLSLVEQFPVSLFLELLDAGELRALVKAPHIVQLLNG